MSKKLLRVFKIGGKVVEDDRMISEFLHAFAMVNESKVLVHGGGKSVSQMCLRLGIEVEMVDGRRITNAETLEVVKMMLAGVANKNVVGKLQGFGCNAVGLVGADGNTILADKRPIQDGIDYGYVGDVKEVNEAVINGFIESGLVPVFAAMTHDGKGNLLNTNADTVASSIAIGMAGSFDVELNYCFELNGVLKDIGDPSSVIHVISHSNYAQMKKDGLINSGMIPKIDNAFNALNYGVREVRIMNYRHISDIVKGKDRIGTLIIN